MSCNNTLVLLHLSLIPGVGPRTIHTIVQSFQKDVTAVDSPDDFLRGAGLLAPLYSFSIRDFQERCGLSFSIAQKLVEGLACRKILNEEQVHIEKNGAHLVTMLDDNYPSELSHIHLPPPVLYCLGRALKAQEKRIAIIGSRTATSYGKEVVNHLVHGLAPHHWTVVSGGALGIDAAAHEAALHAEIATIVVLGSGFLHPYPAVHTKLFTTIAQANGTVITPFSMDTTPHKGNFPARNRIIAGMSQGCIVVQAAQKSGALISAHCALEEGRQVFAVPGQFEDPLSEGCHALIKQGAKLIHSVHDVLEEFGEIALPSAKKNQSTFSSAASSRGVSSLQQATVEQDESTLYGLLKQPCSLDELGKLTKQNPATLHAELFDLQIEGKVRQNFAGLWERC